MIVAIGVAVMVAALAATYYARTRLVVTTKQGLVELLAQAHTYGVHNGYAQAEQHWLACQIAGACPGRLNAIRCQREPGHGGRHVASVGRAGWNVSWEVDRP